MPQVNIWAACIVNKMENSNVNNLNGIPNFGHGFPENVPVDEITTDAAAPEGVEIETKEETPMEEVEITNQE